MFLWLISPKNVFHGERISRPRKAYLSALIAFVYVFAYVNLQELNHRQKMVSRFILIFFDTLIEIRLISMNLLSSAHCIKYLLCR